jgi:hypothetical protein
MRTKVLALFLAAICLAVRAEDENPYKKANVGDWVEFKSSTVMPQMKMESKMKQTVTAKTEKEVTVKMDMEMPNMPVQSNEMKIDLTTKYDPTTAGMPPGAKVPKIEKLAEGDETLNIGGKEYKSHWVSQKMETDMGGAKMESQMKTWTSKDAPLTGMVRMETKMTGAMAMTTTMELTGSGSSAK